MASPLNVTLPENTLRRAAYESRLDGASKSEVVRYAWLRLFMSASEARATVFGTDLSETNGRVGAYIPQHELNLGREKYPDMNISQIARFALALAAGETPEQAKAFAEATKPGRPQTSRERITA